MRYTGHTMIDYDFGVVKIRVVSDLESDINTLSMLLLNTLAASWPIEFQVAVRNGLLLGDMHFGASFKVLCILQMQIPCITGLYLGLLVIVCCSPMLQLRKVRRRIVLLTLLFFCNAIVKFLPFSRILLCTLQYVLILLWVSNTQHILGFLLG